MLQGWGIAHSFLLHVIISPAALRFQPPFWITIYFHSRQRGTLFPTHPWLHLEQQYLWLDKRKYVVNQWQRLWFLCVVLRVAIISSERVSLVSRVGRSLHHNPTHPLQLSSPVAAWKRRRKEKGRKGKGGSSWRTTAKKGFPGVVLVLLWPCWWSALVDYFVVLNTMCNPVCD